MSNDKITQKKRQILQHNQSFHVATFATTHKTCMFHNSAFKKR